MLLLRNLLQEDQDRQMHNKPLLKQWKKAYYLLIILGMEGSWAGQKKEF